MIAKCLVCSFEISCSFISDRECFPCFPFAVRTVLSTKSKYLKKCILKKEDKKLAKCLTEDLEILTENVSAVLNVVLLL